MDREIDAIKRQHFDAFKNRDVILIVRHDYGYQVEQWTPDGVAPTSDYDTAQEAAARALQLLKLKEPVRPQSWPEMACIGNSSPPPLPSKRIV